MTITRMQRVSSWGAALLAACATAEPPPPVPTARPTNCLSRAETRPLVQFCAKHDCPAIVMKRHPELRSLVSAAQRVAEDRTFVHLASDRCVPESVGLFVEYSGPPAALQAAGFVSESVVANGPGSSIAAGVILTVDLPALAAIDDVVRIEGGGSYLPEESR